MARYVLCLPTRWLTNGGALDERFFSLIITGNAKRKPSRTGVNLLKVIGGVAVLGAIVLVVLSLCPATNCGLKALGISSALILAASGVAALILPFPPGSAERERWPPAVPDDKVALEISTYNRERISHHESATYDNMKFFVTISTGIVAALGYVAWNGNPNQSSPLSRQDLVCALFLLQCLVGLLFAASICLHYRSMWRHWNDQVNLGLRRERVLRRRCVEHVQPYFVISIFLLLIGTYFLVVKPLLR